MVSRWRAWTRFASGCEEVSSHLLA